MASNDAKDEASGFRSVSGQDETAEPVHSSASSTSTIKKGSSTQGTQRSSQSSASSSAIPTLRKSSSSNLTTILSPAAGSSPRVSRNASPIRKDKPPTSSANLSSQPSAAALQRALSASNVQQSQSQQQQQNASSLSDVVSRKAREQKGINSGHTTPSWPISPRLKSPPPSGPGSKRDSNAALRKPESVAAPSISVQNATPQNAASMTEPGKDALKSDQALELQPPAAKTPSRGPSGKSVLETVQETSTDVIAEPSAAALQASSDLKPLSKIGEGEAQSSKRPAGEKHSQPGESGSESAENKSDGASKSRRASVTQTNASNARRSKSTTSKSNYPMSAKRHAEGKTGMTVETETVQSIPQSALNAGDRSTRIDSGSVRLKASNETIRPKKERKKNDRKTRSVNQGTGTYSTQSPSDQRSSPRDRRHGSGSQSSTRSAPQYTGHELGSPLVRRPVSNPFQLIRRWSSAVVGSSSKAPMRDVHSPNLSERLRHAIATGGVMNPSVEYACSRNRFGSISNLFGRKATSKADLFEARVANAVDEANANTSDSDETFVYESNPPEPQRRQRHHSRTPSVTSSHSVVEQQRGVMRSLADPFDDRRVGGKRSMKFSSNPYNDFDSTTSHDGTVRSHTPRHIGRFGRGGHHSASQAFNQDSPFTQASKARNHRLLAQAHSRPNSPKSPQSMQYRPTGLFGKKNERSYEFDTEQNADDEQTPLMGSVRGPRGMRHSRHFNSDSIHSLDYPHEERGCCNGRVSACLLAGIVLVLVLLSAIGFIFASNRPLYDVKIHKIQNVLASEQELMFDLLIGAVNPNTLGISITDMNVSVFAKSKHVGAAKPPEEEDTARRRTKRARRPAVSDHNPNPSQDLSGHWHAPGSNGNHDHGTDPDPDDDTEKESQTMLLGRLFHFDQALTFDASPIKQHEHRSAGQVQLLRPGNATEAGGSARWERVMQAPFELIVRGVLKYALPVSGRAMSVAVGTGVMVHPEEGSDSRGIVRTEPVDVSERWEWIEWGEEVEEEAA